MTRNLPKTSEKKRTGVNLVDHLSGLGDDFDGDDPCVPQDEYDYAQTPVPARASCAQTHEQPVPINTDPAKNSFPPTADPTYGTTVRWKHTFETLSWA